MEANVLCEVSGVIWRTNPPILKRVPGAALPLLTSAPA